MIKTEKTTLNERKYISKEDFNLNLDSLMNELRPSFNTNCPVFVGVSGGPDSMTLSYLLKMWSQKKKY